MDTKTLPVLKAVRESETGVLVSVTVTTQEDPVATFEIFSGKKDRTHKTLPAYREKGEIPSGTWYITTTGKQRPPAEIVAQLKSKRILNLTGDARYRAVTAKHLWLSLLRDDRSSFFFGDINDFTLEGFTLRDGIRLHFGERSHGCFTFRNLEDYVALLRKLAKVKPLYFDKQGQPVAPGAPDAIKVFGKLIVPN
jgi:hypothetical protein